MARIEIRSEREFERSLKRFKMRCLKEGIFKECRERRHFVKPSQKRRERGKKKRKM